MKTLTLKTLFLLVTLVVYQLSFAQETLNWTANIPPGGWPNGTFGPHVNNTVCHSRGSLTAQFNNPLGITLPNIFAGGASLPTPFPFGLALNPLVLSMQGANLSAGTSISMNFTYPVENLTFSVYDIDGSFTTWRDRIIVTGSLGGTAVPITISTCPTLAGTVCTGSGTNTATISAGTNNVAFTNAAGRADITISGALDSINIQYQNHTVNPSGTQIVGITELTYDCAIVGVAKQMTRRAGQAFGVSPYIVDIDFNFENFGDLNLSNLTSLEDLDAVFNLPPNVSNYTVTSITKTAGPASFTANASFDGSAAQELIGASSSLTPGQTATIRVTLAVNNYDSYTNTVSVTGTTPNAATTSENSTNGTDADGADGDNNPDESTPSPLNTTSLPISLNYVATHKNKDNSINIEWQTDIEFNHIGFKIYQEEDNGEKYQLSDLVNQAQKQQNGALKTYSLNLKVKNNNPIWLSEYTNKGKEIWHGPFKVNDYAGEKIQQSKIKWAQKTQQVKALFNVNELAISVSQTGMQRITTNDLLIAGFDTTNMKPSDVAILLDEKSIPIFINGNTKKFDNTTSIDFYAQSIDSIYTTSRIYKLSTSHDERNYISRNLTKPSSNIKTWYWQTEKYNPNLVYDFSSPTNDPWRAETLATFANSSKLIEFPLDELSQLSQDNIQLNIKTSGGLDYQQIPDVYPTDSQRCGANHADLYQGMPNDHCLKLSINNKHLDDIVFDGLSIKEKNYQLDSNLSNSGTIALELNLPGETGFAYDIINIEEISIKYPRNLTAINDALMFKVADNSRFINDVITQSGFDNQTSDEFISNNSTNKAAFMVDGFNNQNIIAYALNPNGTSRIINTKIINTELGYGISIPSVSNIDKYWVSTEQSLIKPQLTTWHPYQKTSFEQKDYIMISHPEFIDTIQQLKNHHESQGLTVGIVNVNDIYAKYSKSIIDPQAIKKYIKDLSVNGNLKYVLLVGADNYDYKGYLSNLHFSHIPSIYSAIDDTVRYAPTDGLFTDLDNDNIPDIAIGRMPARNTTELQLLIDKQFKFINQSTPNLSTHFIADAQDSNFSYAQISNELIASVPSKWNKTTTYRDDFADTSSTKQQLVNNFASNPRLTTYLGHSGPRNWFSFPSAFTYNDISQLDNSLAASVILQWGCWNSYYVEPDANTMAHKFLFDSDKGAVAIFGASALTTVASEKALAKIILPELLEKNNSLGESMLNAKKQLAQSGDYKDIILGWNLLGDPALKLSNSTSIH